MNDLDEALGEIAGSFRPTHQPDLDDLVRRSRRRHLSALASGTTVAAVVAFGAVLLGTADDQREVVVPTVTAAPRPAADCDFTTDNAIRDYVDFVHVDGVTLTHGFGPTPYPTVNPEDLEQNVDTVRCRLADTDGRATTEHVEDGTSSFLPVGTVVQAVRGYDPKCRVAAREDGTLKVYLALDEAADVATPKNCAVGPPKGHVIGHIQTLAETQQRLSGTVTITSATGQTITVPSPAHGRFDVWLLPGTYVITATSPQYKGGRAPCTTVLTPETVVVVGQLTTAVVGCP